MVRIDTADFRSKIEEQLEASNDIILKCSEDFAMTATEPEGSQKHQALLRKLTAESIVRNTLLSVLECYNKCVLENSSKKSSKILREVIDSDEKNENDRLDQLLDSTTRYIQSGSEAIIKYRKGKQQ